METVVRLDFVAVVFHQIAAKMLILRLAIPVGMLFSRLEEKELDVLRIVLLMLTDLNWILIEIWIGNIELY